MGSSRHIAKLFRNFEIFRFLIVRNQVKHWPIVAFWPRYEKYGEVTVHKVKPCPARAHVLQSTNKRNV